MNEMDNQWDTMNHDQQIIINKSKTSRRKPKQKVLSCWLHFQLEVEDAVSFPRFELCVQFVDDLEDFADGAVV